MVLSSGNTLMQKMGKNLVLAIPEPVILQLIHKYLFSIFNVAGTVLDAGDEQ